MLLAVFLCFAVLFVVLIDIRVRPMIKTYGNNQAVTAATKAVNIAVSDILSKLNLQYQDLVTITTDENGEITEMTTNSKQLNTIKSDVTAAIFTELDRQDMQNVSIPLGSLAGGLLTGRGPNITIRVPMNSTVETSFDNVFEGAGINQTRHEVMLDVKVTVYAVIRGEDTKTVVNTQFALAENIIVGEVPQWMTGTSSIGTSGSVASDSSK